MINILTQFSLIALGIVGLTACQTPTHSTEEAWHTQLTENLSKVGSRNWIVIGESSFPAYSGASTTTMVTHKPAEEVFSNVLDVLEAEGHTVPRIMVCSELHDIQEDYAPGIKKYRSQINKLLPGRTHFSLKSNIINGMMEDAVKQYQVLVIKTGTSLPYSNIFIELDSSYWSTDSETALRKQISAQEAKLKAREGATVMDVQLNNKATPQPLNPANQPPIPPSQNKSSINADNLPTLPNSQPKEQAPAVKPNPVQPTIKPLA